MIKLVAALRKKDGMSFEEFQQYYETHHSKLISNIPTATRYIRRYVRDCKDETGRSVDPDFHVLTEVWFETQSDFDAALARLGDPELAQVYRSDERNLFDMTRLRTFVVEEHESPL
jgi:uncharacterized protein (TIGR02118 family)